MSGNGFAFAEAVAAHHGGGHRNGTLGFGKTGGGLAIALTEAISAHHGGGHPNETVRFMMASNGFALTGAIATPPVHAEHGTVRR